VTTLSVSIMGHPSRAERIEALQARLGKRVPVSMDTGGEGAWRVGRRAWSSAGEADYHVVLQDDVLVCEDFIASAEQALWSVRHALVADHRASTLPVCFYANRKVVTTAREGGSSWALIPDGLWGQAICLPTHLVGGMLLWCDENTRDDFYSYDARITLWALSEGLPALVTVPSLVEHDEPSGSLMGHNNKKRVARWFIGEDVSGLPVDWSAGVYTDRIPRGGSISFDSFAKQFPGALNDGT